MTNFKKHLTTAMFCIVVLFSQNGHAQTYGKLYDLYFQNTATLPHLGWTQHSIFANSAIDSTISVDGKSPLKICYRYKMKKNEESNLRFNLGQMVLLPEVTNKDTECEIKINSKNKNTEDIYFKVSGFDTYQNTVFSDSITLNSAQWKESSLKFRVSNIRTVYIAVKYNGNLKDEQCIWFDRVTISLDGKSIHNQPVYTSTYEPANKTHATPLLLSGDSILLRPIKQLQDKKIIGLAECTYGSQTIKDWTYILLKNLILTNNCKLIMVEGNPDLFIKINAYIQGLLPAEYEAEIEEQIRFYYFDDYVSRFNFIKWLRQYNASANEKVHYLGINQHFNPQKYLFDFFMSVLGSKSEQEKSYLIKIHKEQYSEVLDQVSKDTDLQQRLGKEFYEYLATVLDELSKSSNGSLEPDKEMSQRIINTTNIFLTNNKTSAIIAHSAHLIKNAFYSGLTTNNYPLGYFLNQDLGKDYYNINFLVGDGDVIMGKNRQVIKKLMPNPNTSIESRFMKLDYDILFYPSDKLKHDIYETRSLSRTSARDNQFVFSYPDKEFNAYIFIRQSKALPNISTRNPFKHINQIEHRRIKFLKDNGLNWSIIHSPAPGQLTNDLDI